MDECGGAHACTGEAQPEEDQQTPLPGILASLPTAVITLRGERAAAAVVAGANPALVEVLGRPVPSGVPLAQIAGADDLYRPDRRTPVHCTDLLIAPAIDRGETVRRVEVHLRRPDGEWRVLLASAAPLRRDGRIVGAVASLENITERRHADEQVQTRARQQAAVAALGQRALEETNSQALMVEACESLARTLAVERSQVLELLPDGETLLMRAGVGWREGLVGHAMVSASADSPAGYALRAQAPVFVEELCTDARFPGPVSLHEQDVVSGIFVAILGRDRPFGVLAAQSTRRRTFTEADVHFLQAIANVLAAAVERQRSSEELRQRFEQLRRIHHLSDAVSLASGMEAIYTEALDALQLTVGADRASVLLFDPDGAMRFKAWRGLSDTYRKAVEGHTPWQADASDPQPVLVPDVEQDPELAGLLPVFSAEGIRAVAFIPLMHLARLVGKFMLYYNAPHRFTADEVQLARTVARHVALALARTVAEDALRDSESRYRMLMEQASDAICITDIQGNIVSVNSKVVEMGGYTREELLGMNITALIPPEDLKANPLQIPQVMAGESVMHERRARRKDGSIFPVEISAKRIDGGLIQGIVRDITVRKRAENSLRFLAEASNVLYSSLDYTHTVERLARLVVPTLGDWCIMYVIEEDDTVRRAAVVHADPAKADLAARLMACPAPVIEQVRPQLEALESGRPQFLPSVPEPLLRALATGGPKHLAILHELGATAAMVVPFRGRGRLLGVAHFFLTEPGRRYDPADLALAEETARRAAVAVENASLYQEARQANEAKDQFLAVLSHELRNPLASILGGVDILRRTIPQDERSQRAIEIVDRNARLQARLVNDLLDLSRIARGMIQLQRAPIALSDVVDAAVQGARGDAEDAGLSLSADAVPGLWVHGDLDRLQQVVGNLLSTR